jgi:acyl-CoA thioester hydrolase
MTRPAQQHLEIRIRGAEVDSRGLLHHAAAFTYFEMGRMELLRHQGGNYKDLEDRGYFLVVVRFRCSFHSPARCDDVLDLETHITRQTPAKLEHAYRLSVGDLIVAEASSVVACINRRREVQELTDDLLFGNQRA